LPVEGLHFAEVWRVLGAERNGIGLDALDHGEQTDSRMFGLIIFILPQVSVLGIPRIS